MNKAQGPSGESQRGPFGDESLGTTNSLNKVHDEGVIFTMLQGSKENDAEVYVWRFLAGQKHLGLVRIEAIRKSRGDFCIVPQEGQDRIVQELMGSLSTIDLYIPSYALLLRCSVRQTEAPFRYYLQIPLFVAQIERRQSLRLNVSEERDIQVAFEKTINLMKPTNQLFQKSCFDISPGGVSFFVSRTEAKAFDAADFIKSLEVKAGSWRTKVEAEVISVTEVEPNQYNGLSYKAWRVACRFSNMEQLSRKYLEKFIFERIKDELHVING